LSDRGFDPRRVGADRGYHNRGFVQGCRQRAIIPHVAPMPDRKVPRVDGRTFRTATYRISQVIRRRIEEIFGWCKTTGGLWKCRYRGVARNHGCAQSVGAAWNLLRIAKLTLTAPPPPAAGVTPAKAAVCPHTANSPPKLWRVFSALRKTNNPWMKRQTR
jgi:hypothetical protein